MGARRRTREKTDACSKLQACSKVSQDWEVDSDSRAELLKSLMRMELEGSAAQLWASGMGKRKGDGGAADSLFVAGGGYQLSFCGMASSLLEKKLENMK